MPNIQGLPRDATTGALIVSGTGLTPMGILPPPDQAAASLNYRKAVAKGRFGGTIPRVVMQGDSTTLGTFSGTNPGGLVRRDYVSHSRARQELNAGNMFPGVIGESLMNMNTADDARFTYTGGAGGPTLATGQTMVFADADTGHDAYDLVVLKTGAAASIVVSGTEVVGTPLTIDISAQGSNTALVYRVPMSSTTIHTITIAGPAAGSVQITNLEPITIAAPPILKLGGFGVGGRTLASINPGATGSGSIMAPILRPLPAAIHLLLGVNDMRNSADLAAGAATYKTNLDLFVTACLSQNTDCVLWTAPSYFSNQSGVASDTESILFHQAVYEVARNRNLWVVDLARRWGYGVNPTTGSSSTPVTNSAFYDGTHPTLLGYWDMGGLLARVLVVIAG